MTATLNLSRPACWLDGQWTTAADGAVIDVNNPATGERCLRSNRIRVQRSAPEAFADKLAKVEALVAVA